jgi:hypothetical protein
LKRKGEMKRKEKTSNGRKEETRSKSAATGPKNRNVGHLVETSWGVSCMQFGGPCSQTIKIKPSLESPSSLI